MLEKDSKENNDSLNVATSLIANDSLTNLNIHWKTDEDWFSFETTERTKVTLTTYGATSSSIGSVDSEMWLYDSSGKEISYNDSYNFPETKFSQISDSLNKGKYYVRVREDVASTGISQYGIFLEVGDDQIVNIKQKGWSYKRSTNGVNIRAGESPVQGLLINSEGKIFHRVKIDSKQQMFYSVPQFEKIFLKLQ